MMRTRQNHRFDRHNAPSLRNWGPKSRPPSGDVMPTNVLLECGWGRLIFAHTFDSAEKIAETLRQEQPDKRDIALYLRDPHVVLAAAPQELFLDPSHTYRLWMSHYRSARARPRGFTIRRLRTKRDAQACRRITLQRRMVPADIEFVLENRKSRTLTYLVATDDATDEVIGTVTGVDHAEAFGDPENGSSLWCLAVDPQASQARIGEALVRTLAEHYQARGRDFMDLSVLHDNEQAIALYEKLGFQRVPVFCLKTKNAVNERLFTGPQPDANLNPYASIIVEEARRRGIAVSVLDADAGYFRLTFGGRSVICREALSELTTAIAMSRCDDKAVTRRVLAEAGLTVPDQIEATGKKENEAFLSRYGRVVVKPVSGEQGVGIAVDVRSPADLKVAVDRARRHNGRVLIEELIEGKDLRIIVIDFKVVAAAIRKPAQITGNGRDTIRDLIATQSRRRSAATGGESAIPIDDETKRCIRVAGHEMDTVLPAGMVLTVRRTANLHTGGTIHDVTGKLHPTLAAVAERAARALDIPVVGLDLIVPRADAQSYAIIEANERPGLANHEPQPTAERFIDLLFPQTVPTAAAPQSESPTDK